MLSRLHGFIRSDITVAGFVTLGLGINSLLHLYRFHRIDWDRVTGLWGQSQSIILSFVLGIWVIVPFIFAKRMLSSMRRSVLAITLIPLALIVINQICGRSMLKLLFDALLIAILYVWFLIDYSYAKYTEKPPTEGARSFVISELMTIFQISLAILTFVIATFGFSFAPSYIEKYYQQEIGQPTVWWFGFMTLYLSMGVIWFITMQAWTLAVQLRSKL